MKTWIFKLDDGGPKKITIVNALFENEAQAEQRAKSEFLEKGHKIKRVSFRTWRTDLRVGDIVNAGGLNYRIERVESFWSDGEIGSEIEGKRYE